MKILVTGAAGFIASKIMAMLSARGDEVVVTLAPDGDPGRGQGHCWMPCSAQRSPLLLCPQ